MEFKAKTKRSGACLAVTLASFICLVRAVFFMFFFWAISSLHRIRAVSFDYYTQKSASELIKYTHNEPYKIKKNFRRINLNFSIEMTGFFFV